MNITYTVIESKPGQILSAECDESLIYVDFGDKALARLTEFVRKHHQGCQIVPSVLESGRQIQEYLNGGRREFDLPLEMKGTDFQKEVWEALLQIPYGQTSTYGELALKLHRENSSRAVGQACGANPIPLVVPCHRVLSSAGRLGGYSSGLDWKKWFLGHEGVPAESFRE